MITCRDARDRLWEVAGGELDGEAAAAVHTHARECADCGRELAELEAVVGLSRRVGHEPLPEGWTLELRQRLSAATPAQPQRWRVRRMVRPVAYAAVAAAAAVLLFVAGARVGSGPAVARVPSSKVALVRIEFVAARDVEDVQFEVMLPDGLRFVSEGHELTERSFRWSGRLAAGPNPIPIAVRGPRAGRYRVIAHAVGRDLDITHEVVLEVSS